MRVLLFVVLAVLVGCASDRQEVAADRAACSTQETAEAKDKCFWNTRIRRYGPPLHSHGI